ncbi:PLP-dependent aminotransferase family protein [bacterium]|nr:PLP-dependent aminotransferase family protein [bacterium]
METLQKNPTVRLYERVATQIARLIEHGAFRPGERIPSVRELSRQQQVSVTTVLEAYRSLEDRGLIEARPQSGYFVRARPMRLPPEPETSAPALRPTQVSTGELVMMVMRDVRDPALLQLGAAIPNLNLLPAEKLTRIMASIGRYRKLQSNSYDVAPGYRELRVQIARRLLTAGCALTPDEIVTTTGCQEALSLCLRTLCRPGDAVAIESPTYHFILQAIEVLGLRAVEIPTHPREGVILEALRLALDENPIRACLFVLNFSNPLGSCMPEEKKQTLVEMLTEREIPLIEDDIYGDLSFSPERPKVARAFDQKGLVLLCSSFSKTLSPGYRVGWVAPGRFQAEIERLKVVSSLATATLPQMAIAELLANGGYDHYLRKVRRVYARQVALMTRAIGKFFPEGTKVTRPSGGFVLWVELPGHVDSLELYEKARQAGITFAPGPIFSAKQRYRNFARLNAANWSEETEIALIRLGQMAAGLRR